MKHSPRFARSSALIGTILLTGVAGCAPVQETPAAPTTVADATPDLQRASAVAQPAAATGEVAETVTSERIKTLPAKEQAAWQSYLERSQELARADQAALDAEVKAGGMAKALKAPDGGDFKLPAKEGESYYAGAEAKQLADVILSYQTPSGGWSKHTGYSVGPRKPGMQWSSQYEPGKSPHYLATFDNRSTTEQMYFLAYAWHATKREDCKAAFVKGLNFILDAQYPNGGWPQVYPLEGGYHDHITFNDDAMTRILGLLQSIGSDEPYYAFLTDAQRARAATALEAGLRCVLATQVEQNGTKTVWCAQYDPLALQPSQARKMEPATLSGAESARILEFLMSIEKPSSQIVASIESGLAWFEKSKLSQGANDGEESGRWARFYDLKTGKPVFPGRDGVLYDTFEAMAEKNKLGYDYFSTKPNSLLNSRQKKWRKMLAKSGAAQP